MARPRSTASAAASKFIYDELKAGHPVIVQNVADAFGLPYPNVKGMAADIRLLVMDEDGVYINHPSYFTDWAMMKTTDPDAILPGIHQIAATVQTVFIHEHQQAKLWTPSVTGRTTLRATANADLINAANVGEGAATLFLSKIDALIATR